ncbi:hypothetical protein SAMN05421823_106271 [Catalinimonas alkaloidigena]|uniref:LemA protein n=1 Tax=Catalinimonas alkaloidigena TaxID=1075417 RepID=A0A1G9KW67_9BACT|nr:hypothetical protein [Catalinimonas alkaloidigena]SDL53952.1 hypothetical protein SAMN05421823_106271 [Catalinimonas alkaloidigena]
MRTFSILMLALLLGAASCNKTSSPAELAQLQTQADSLRDSLDHYWQVMMVSDDVKAYNVGRLLQELSYADSADPIALERVRMQQEAILSKRYDRQSMAESAAIDRYDAATDSLLRSAFQLAATTPGFENYKNGADLAREIKQADDSILLYRNEYDEWAKSYNLFLKQHGDDLQVLGEPYTTWQPLPIFELSE